MFRTAVITDEISQDIFLAADLARRFQLDGVEIRSINNHGPFELTVEDIRQIQSALQGMPVCCISAPFFKCDLNDGADIREHLDGLRHVIQLAGELGCHLIRGFSFWDTGDFDGKLDQIAEQYQIPAELAGQAGITLALESDPSVHTTNAASLAKLVEAVGNKRVRALWDPGNDIYDPKGETPYPQGYETIRPYLCHVHLKDAVKTGQGPECTPIGRGSVDWKGQFQRLIADGYDGYVSLETHYRPKKKLSEQSMALPGGQDFSDSGYEATEESLSLWRDMMRHL